MTFSCRQRSRWILTLALLVGVAGPAFAQNGSISGRISNAWTGAFLGGITVTFYDANNTPVGGSTTTAGDGTYAKSLPPGTYYIRSSHPGFVDTLYKFDGGPNYVNCFPSCNVTSGSAVVVTAGATNANRDFSTWPGASIAGTVTAPIAVGATQVALYTSAGVFARAQTVAGDGTYFIGQLPAARYYAKTIVPPSVNLVREAWSDIPCLVCAPTTGTSITLANAEALGGVDFALAVGGTIGGTISDEGTASPLVGLDVWLFTASSAFVTAAVTDGTGTYLFAGLPTGNYYVRTGNAQASGRANEWFNNVAATEVALPVVATAGTPVSVTAGAGTSGIDIAIGPGGAIAGTVIDNGSSTPLAGITISLLAGSGVTQRSAQAAVDGTYSFPGLPAGIYFVRTRNTQGYLDQLHVGQPCLGVCAPANGTPVIVSLGATATADFSLVAGGRVSGTVTNASNSAPLANAIVRIYTASGLPVAEGASDGSGAYVTSPGLPTGTYYARTFGAASAATAFAFADEVYNNLNACEPGCQPTSGTGIIVTAGNTATNIDFSLTPITELVKNGRFRNGFTDWQTFATPSSAYIAWALVNETAQFGRVPPPPGTANQAVLYQDTGAAIPANAPLVVRFDLRNSSAVRKRISVLVVDQDFSDLSVCTFWLPPNSPALRYGIRTRTTEAWTNARLAFYAASTNTPDGFFELDNVSMYSPAGATVERTDCFDPLVPGAPGGGSGPNLLVNGDFSSGSATPGWGTFGNLTFQVAGGVFEFIRAAAPPPGTASGVVLQPTVQAVPANTLVTATFQLGNSSGVRKRVTAILHDNNFSDLSACTFWLPPGQALSTYTYRAYTTQAWTNATISIYPATTGVEQWIRLDNVTLRLTPGAPIAGAECVEPNSTLPDR